MTASNLRAFASRDRRPSSRPRAKRTPFSIERMESRTLMSVVPVSNASFESNVAADNRTTSVAAWTIPGSVGNAYNPINSGYTNATDTSPTLGALAAPGSGKQVLYINGAGSASQTLTTKLVANTTYKLTVAIGNRGDLKMGNYEVALYAGFTRIASASGSGESNAANFTFRDVSAQSTAVGYSSLIGQNLRIVLTNLNTAADAFQVNFDNVRLTSEVLPPDAFEYDDTPATAKTIAANGVTQTRSLHTTTDEDWVKFTLASASNVRIETNGVAGGDTVLILYRSSDTNTIIGIDGNAGNGNYSLITPVDSGTLAAGTYYVRVLTDHFSGQQGDAPISSYTLKVTPYVLPAGFDKYEPNDNSAATATVIATNGIAQSHSIHVAGSDVDWVKFTLTSTQNVRIETAGASGDTELRLYRSTDTINRIAYDNDAGAGSFSLINLTGASALTAGTYYVRINEFGSNAAISSYTIKVTEGDSFENDDTPATAKTIATNGVAQTHSRHTTTDVDWVKFTLASASNVRIETDGVAGGDTALALYRTVEFGGELAYDSDSGNGNYALITAAETGTLAAGTYYVSVNEVVGSFAISSYTLKVTAYPLPASDAFEYDNTPATAKTITTNGVAQTHSRHSMTDVDWVKFTLASASNVRIETDGVADGETVIALYKSPVVIYEDFANDRNSGNGNYSLLTSADIGTLAAGTYYVSVNEFDYPAISTISSYTIKVTAYTLPAGADQYEPNDNSAAMATNISPYGGTQTHSIHGDGSDVDWFKFTLTFTQNVRIETNGVTEDDTFISLYRSSDTVNPIASDDDSGNGNYSLITDGALAAGTYFVKVSEFYGLRNISSYTLSVSLV